MKYLPKTRHVFKDLLSENITSEYWIDENGQIVNANGEVSDYNHEIYVQMSILGDFKDYGDKERAKYIKKHIDKILDYELKHDSMKFYDYYLKNKEQDQTFEDFYSEKDNIDTFIDEIMDKGDYETAYIIINYPEEQVEDVLDGLWKDPRKFAMKTWEWIRVASDDFQVYDLSSNHLKRIAEAIYELDYDLQIAVDNDTLPDIESEDYDASKDFTYTIEDIKTHKVYWNIPYKIIDSGDIGKLLRYKEL